MGSKTGGNTSGVEMSPKRRRSQAARRRAQEKRWAAKAGPVTVSRIEEREKED